MDEDEEGCDHYGNVEVAHVFTKDAASFETAINERLNRIIEDGGAIGDIKYSVTQAGFGALIIYEIE
ncbi:MAG: hypothetical protein HYV63_17855 [Candidatus Schekmanbacteria bacterium]|nr:hypothetical protein [Candidatus Schekmanbacteria bacterium]